MLLITLSDGQMLSGGQPVRPPSSLLYPQSRQSAHAWACPLRAKTLRIHEVGNAGRGPCRNYIARKARHRTACISHQRLDAEIKVRCVTVLPDLPIYLSAHL